MKIQTPGACLSLCVLFVVVSEAIWSHRTLVLSASRPSLVHCSVATPKTCPSHRLFFPRPLSPITDVRPHGPRVPREGLAHSARNPTQHRPDSPQPPRLIPGLPPAPAVAAAVLALADLLPAPPSLRRRRCGRPPRAIRRDLAFRRPRSLTRPRPRSRFRCLWGRQRRASPASPQRGRHPRRRPCRCLSFQLQQQR